MGSWNRFVIEMSNLEAMAVNLHTVGVHYRNEIVTGVGGKQITLEDTVGNPIELFQPILP